MKFESGSILFSIGDLGIILFLFNKIFFLSKSWPIFDIKLKIFVSLFPLSLFLILNISSSSVLNIIFGLLIDFFMLLVFCLSLSFALLNKSIILLFGILILLSNFGTIISFFFSLILKSKEIGGFSLNDLFTLVLLAILVFSFFVESIFFSLLLSLILISSLFKLFISVMSSLGMFMFKSSLIIISFLSLLIIFSLSLSSSILITVFIDFIAER